MALIKQQAHVSRDKSKPRHFVNQSPIAGHNRQGGPWRDGSINANDMR
jgi:hypothetical protein